MTPIELLRKQLFEYQKALSKSFESYRLGQIKKELHDTHKANLEPKIFKYEQAINVLEMWQP